MNRRKRPLGGKSALALQTIPGKEEFLSLLRGLVGTKGMISEETTCVFCQSSPSSSSSFQVDKGLHFLATSCFSYAFPEDFFLENETLNFKDPFLCKVHLDEVKNGMDLIKNINLLTQILKRIQANLKSAVLNKVIANTGTNHTNNKIKSSKDNLQKPLGLSELLIIPDSFEGHEEDGLGAFYPIKSEPIEGDEEVGDMYLPSPVHKKDVNVNEVEEDDQDEDDFFELSPNNGNSDSSDEDWVEPATDRKVAKRSRRIQKDEDMNETDEGEDKSDNGEEKGPVANGKRRRKKRNMDTKPRVKLTKEELREKHLARQKNDSDTKRIKMWHCQICNGYFESQDKLKEHKTTHESEERTIPCPTCLKMYRTDYEMTGHLKSVHPQEGKTFPCTVKECSLQFTTYAKMKHHRRSVHTMEVQTCPQCTDGKRYKSLYAHIRNFHHQKHRKNYLVCEHCGKSYPRTKDLAKHMALQHDNVQSWERVMCPECGKSLCDEGSLRKHMLSQHMKSFQYECPLCQAQFLFKSQYATHLKTVLGQTLSTLEIEEMIKNCKKVMANSDRISFPQGNVQGTAHTNCKQQSSDDNLQPLGLSKLLIIPDSLEDQGEDGFGIGISYQIENEPSEGEDQVGDAYSTSPVPMETEEDVNEVEEDDQDEDDLFVPSPDNGDTDSSDEEWTEETKPKTKRRCRRNQKSEDINEGEDKSENGEEKSPVANGKRRRNKRNKDNKEPRAKLTKEELRKRRLARHKNYSATKRCKLWHCQICNSYFKSQEELKEHKTTHVSEERTIPCPKCLKMYRTDYEMSCHLKSAHPPEGKTFPCTVKECSLQFTTYDKMRRHRRVHTKVIKTCPHCTDGKRYKDLDAHIRNFHEGRQKKNYYLCEHCGKGYRRTADLAKHVALQHLNNWEKVMCPECGKSLSDEASLRKHTLSQHMKSFQYECPLCQAQFLFKSHYANHLNSVHGQALSPLEIEEMVKNCKKVRDNSDRIYGPSLPQGNLQGEGGNEMNAG